MWVSSIIGHGTLAMHSGRSPAPREFNEEIDSQLYSEILVDEITMSMLTSLQYIVMW